jgi:hypothetical protein
VAYDLILNWLKDHFMNQAYETLVNDAAEIRVDLDESLHPAFGHLKTVFDIAFKELGFRRADFKRLSDMVYYKGGYPSENSPPREEALANVIAALAKLELLHDRQSLQNLLAQRGVYLEVHQEIGQSYTTSEKDGKRLIESWQALGKTGTPSTSRTELLKDLVETAQKLQTVICSRADEIKVDAAQTAEDEHKIRKPNFCMAVRLAAMQKRRGEEKVKERVASIEDNIDNLQEAIGQFVGEA